MSRALVRFVEQRYQVYFEDFRVFIQGVEVTPWVNGSVTINRANRDGPGSASFTLDNAMDRFVLTPDNLTGNVWRDTTDRYSEAAKHAIYLYKTGAQEVTRDRVNELAKALFDRNLQITQARTTNEVAAATKNRELKKTRSRNVSREDTEDLGGLVREELQVAASDTLHDLPSDAILNNEAATTRAIADQLINKGMSPGEAERAAAAAVSRRKNELVRAGNQRPTSDGPALETNPDNTKASRKGRFKAAKNLRNPVDTDTGDSRWPLQARSLVFHKNDPVRIFVHNPLTEEDWWLFGFTGFIDQYPMTVDYRKGHSNITVQCYDIKALMQKMRISQNTTLPTVAPEPLFTDRSSIFADLIVPDRWGQAFRNLPFEDAISILTTGTNLERKGQRGRFGIGDLAVGKIVTYPATDNITDSANRATLEEWHTLCINGPSDINDQNSIASLDPLGSADVERIGQGTTSDGVFAPMRAYVHFLLPAEGTAARNLVQQTFDTGTEQRDWTNRFQIVSDFCARLDYEFTVLPNGDLIFEFPMYDFLPEDFGDWSSAFIADEHLMDGEIGDESGEMISAVIVTGGVTKPEQDPLANAPANEIPRVILQNSLLASRVGLTTEQVVLPFTREIGRLRSLGMIEFQKRLANANSMSMTFGYRPFMLPNRPVYNVVEQRMGLTSSVVDTMQVFGECNTTANVRFVRQIRADGTFRFITGGASMPVSFREIFRGDTQSVGNSTVGVRAYPEVTGEPSAVDNQETTEDTGSNTGNEDRAPEFITERRPGQFFLLNVAARRVAEAVAQVVSSVDFEMNQTPESNGRIFSIRSRDPDGAARYGNGERASLATRARQLGYVLVDEPGRYTFEPRRPGQPDFILKR